MESPFGCSDFPFLGGQCYCFGGLLVVFRGVVMVSGLRFLRFWFVVLVGTVVLVVLQVVSSRLNWLFFSCAPLVLWVALGGAGTGVVLLVSWWSLFFS